MNTARHANNRCSAPRSSAVRRSSTPSSVLSGVESSNWRSTSNGSVGSALDTGLLRISPIQIALVEKLKSTYDLNPFLTNNILNHNTLKIKFTYNHFILRLSTTDSKGTLVCRALFTMTLFVVNRKMNFQLVLKY